ncbi:MAG TPA: hypothetical protein P5179_03225, partial [Candidatus Latescibacteria bacterium]|nr:hypothetical protein [Candidatus Latescibacterota bacterium]
WSNGVASGMPRARYGLAGANVGADRRVRPRWHTIRTRADTQVRPTCKRHHWTNAILLVTTPCADVE